MNEDITTLIDKLRSDPMAVQFGEVMDVIDTHYKFRPTSFRNGDLQNEEGQNDGACKVFAFAKANKLKKEETLNLFGNYYREDVLGSPEGTDHQNIRNFIKYGWEGIDFDSTALYEK